MGIPLRLSKRDKAHSSASEQNIRHLWTLYHAYRAPKADYLLQLRYHDAISLLKYPLVDRALVYFPNMCGIHACISRAGPQRPSQALQDRLHKRGPDHLGRVESEQDFTANGGSTWLSFTSTVLALRGGHITQQPFHGHVTDSVLCWNGEAWKIKGVEVTGNDGQAVYDLLCMASESASSRLEAVIAVLEAIRLVSGPFAFVFHDKAYGLVYFSRDRLGRRSLLYDYEDAPGALQLASIAEPTGGSWQEVEADAIYVIDLFGGVTPLGTVLVEESEISQSGFSIFKSPWSASDIQGDTISVLGQFNQDAPEEEHCLGAQSLSVGELASHMTESLRLRVCGIPVPPDADPISSSRLAVLFSGGLDCTVLARMSHDLLPIEQSIDLLNVAFENPRVVEAARKEAKKNSSKNAVKDTETPSEPSPYDLCPDRITGRQAFHELIKTCPQRTWRFIEVNIPYDETITHKDRVISLIHPHNTEMDLSIAYALYFASRGIGLARTSTTQTPTEYTTSARVLLSGLGADELFGGYQRHAIAFARRTYPGLISELELDVNRLGKRNLGRDDRVLSHWGREARFPFLDESVVKWALESPVWMKCSFGATETADGSAESRIEPGKKVLRLLAFRLGMRLVSQEAKRAIQFGARTAKMETGRTKGTTLIS